MRTAQDGRGYIRVLAAAKLVESPRLYATFLLFLLSKLFEELPELGDAEKPKLVFFLDEAHLLFKDAPAALLERVEQVVRLIGSKGVSVYLVTPNQFDVPDAVSRELGNRVQHGLRAFTPAEQKRVKSAARTFRKNPSIDTEQAIMELGLGEALVSTLDFKGQPCMVERTLIRPPSSRVGPITNAERRAVIEASPVEGVYDKAEERVSAYEQLQKRGEEPAEAQAEAVEEKAKDTVGGSSSGFSTSLGKAIGRPGVPIATHLSENAVHPSSLHDGYLRQRRWPWWQTWLLILFIVLLYWLTRP